MCHHGRLIWQSAPRNRSSLTPSSTSSPRRRSPITTSGTTTNGTLMTWITEDQQSLNDEIPKGWYKMVQVRENGTAYWYVYQYMYLKPCDLKGGLLPKSPCGRNIGRFLFYWFKNFFYSYDSLGENIYRHIAFWLLFNPLWCIFIYLYKTLLKSNEINYILMKFT